MAYETLDYQVESGILTLSLNRPDHLNAFTVEMAGELVAAFNRASEDDDVKVVILTGRGRAFCAGMDLSRPGNVFGLDEDREPTLAEMKALESMEGVRDTGGTVTLAMYECKKPIIAAVNGAAVGIGATMTLGADIRLASEKTRFGFVFTKLGIVPEACSTWFLPRIVGMSQALEWVYTGEIFDAAEAQRGGLVKAVYAPEALADEAWALARRIADGGAPVSLALARQMMYRNAAQSHPVEAHKVDSLAMFYTSKADGKEGVAAFLEKRDPEYRGAASTDMPPFYPWWS